MNNQKLTDIIKNATEVNLRYSATLLNLSKDYLKAFGQAVTEGQVGDAAAGQTRPAPKPTQLLIAGTKGELVKSAFSINNTSDLEGTATLEVMGNFGDTDISVEPESITLNTGESAVIRVITKIGGDLPVETQQPGVVVVKELGLPVAEIVVCRLPDPPRKKASKKAGTATRKR